MRSKYNVTFDFYWAPNLFIWFDSDVYCIYTLLNRHIEIGGTWIFGVFCSFKRDSCHKLKCAYEHKMSHNEMLRSLKIDWKTVDFFARFALIWIAMQNGRFFFFCYQFKTKRTPIPFHTYNFGCKRNSWAIHTNPQWDTKNENLAFNTWNSDQGKTAIHFAHFV